LLPQLEATIDLQSEFGSATYISMQ
jgi:hypothetical protein